METKVCLGCREEKHVSEFSQVKIGRHVTDLDICKECAGEMVKGGELDPSWEAG